MTDQETPSYGSAYEHALSYTARLHARQMRKAGTGEVPTIPYITHLLEVSALVWQGGGDEEQAIAGLLHDALEDQPHQTSAAELEHLYGVRVRRIVEACSDGEPGQLRDASTWRDRKGQYLHHLASVDDDALLVTVADKVSNARAMVDDLHVVGDVLWSRFNAERADVLWYYRSVVAIAQDRMPANPLVQRLARTVDALVRGVDG